MKSTIKTQTQQQGIGLALLVGLVLTAFVAPSALAKAPETDDEKVLYFIGVVMSGQPGFSSLRADEVGLVTQGLQDALAGNAVEIDAAEYGPKMQLFFQERVEEQVAKEKKASEGYLAEMTAKEGAEKTDSGLIYIETEAGKGASPKATDTVKVHYHGTLANGTVFDSSVDRGEPAEFPLNRVIPCWTEGVAKMKPGGKATLVCPAEIAYGDRGAPPSIPGGATLSFDVELLSVLPAP